MYLTSEVNSVDDLRGKSMVSINFGIMIHVFFWNTEGSLSIRRTLRMQFKVKL